MILMLLCFCNCRFSYFIFVCVRHILKTLAHTRSKNYFSLRKLGSFEDFGILLKLSKLDRRGRLRLIWVRFAVVSSEAALLEAELLRL